MRLKKIGILVPIIIVMLWSVPLETRADVADCGPRAFQEFVAHACDTIPWWLFPARVACEGVELIAQSVTGGVLDLIIDDCCITHDACYAEGGTSACKDKCETAFSSCVADKVKWWMWVTAPQAAAAVNWGAPWTANNIGGDLAGGFNQNNDTTCGNSALYMILFALE